ncbi:MAG: sulfatase-like hydrolase/transferase [Methylobacter sp.]|nr:sulfatase-like hydrolase/transferase [Methylobacter sp.]
MLKKKNNLHTAIAIACMSFSSLGTSTASTDKANFVTIMIDDMGFSDLGGFGSEINTPNIDRLINNGTQLTNYYSASTSTPARAMFFTGRDNHPAGVGNMQAFSEDRPPQQGAPGYEGTLTQALPTFPQLLQGNGYYTMMTGKWDLGSTAGLYPSDRGFNESLVLLPSGDVHYLSDANGKLITSQPPSYYQSLGVNTPYNKNGAPFSDFPPNAFSTDFYTDEAIKMLDHRDKNKPFYLNVAHISSHAPFQAPPDLIAKYLPTYSQGYDKLRLARFNKQKTLGLVKPDAVLPPRDIEVPAWDTLSSEQQQVEAKRLAIYAGLVEKLDQNVGKLIQHLKDIGEYDNTVFFVMSDNGSAGIEPGSPAKESYDSATFTSATFAEIANMGTGTSYIPADHGSGMLSNTPYSRFKKETFEGGVHTAAFVFSPKADAKSRGAKYECLSSVMDISATILQMTKTAYPTTYQGKSIAPMDGVPIGNIFTGDLSCKDPARALGFEQDSAKMIRNGDWKLAQQWTTKFSRWDSQIYLFNLANDPFEQQDLSQIYPDDYKRMLSLYSQYAQKNNVMNVGPRLFSPIANLNRSVSTDVMILGGTQVNYDSLQHVPTLPQAQTQQQPAIAAPKLGDTVDIVAELYPPASQQGLGAKIMIAAYYKPVSATTAGQWTAFKQADNANGSTVVPIIQTVDGSTKAPNFSTVPPFSEPIKSFPDRTQLPIYQGKLAAASVAGQADFKAGVYYFWVAYQLSNGVLEQSVSPIVVTVSP